MSSDRPEPLLFIDDTRLAPLHHGEGCQCGYCNAVAGRAYGCRIYDILQFPQLRELLIHGSGWEGYEGFLAWLEGETPWELARGPSESSAIHNARLLVSQSGYESFDV